MFYWILHNSVFLGPVTLNPRFFGQQLEEKDSFWTLSRDQLSLRKTGMLDSIHKKN